MTIAQQLNIKTFPFSIKDENGNEIYTENSDGLWSKSEYDKNGNVFYYEHSNGFWMKWEYDDNGKVIYREDSKGVISDNRPTKVVEIEGVKYKLVKL